MRAKDVRIGQSYLAKVSGYLTRIVIERESPYGGWEAYNPTTKRGVRVRRARRLRCPLGPEPPVAAAADPHLGDTPVHGEPAEPEEEDGTMSKKRSTKERKAARKATLAEAAAGAQTVPGTEVKAQAKARAKKMRDDGTMSGLDAAAKVLAEAKEPLNVKQMMERIQAQGLWKTGGKTPGATIYSAIIREIANKGDQSRFRKAERGKFSIAS